MISIIIFLFMFPFCIIPKDFDASFLIMALKLAIKINWEMFSEVFVLRGLFMLLF